MRWLSTSYAVDSCQKKIIFVCCVCDPRGDKPRALLLWWSKYIYLERVPGARFVFLERFKLSFVRVLERGPIMSRGVRVVINEPRQRFGGGGYEPRAWCSCNPARKKLKSFERKFWIEFGRQKNFGFGAGGAVCISGYYPQPLSI